MCELVCTAECDALPCDESKSLLFMATVSAPPLCAPVPGGSRGVASGGSRGGGGGSLAGPSAAGLSELAPASAASLQLLDICSLEGCGLGWRVRPPLRRRSPWTVVAQRMRLTVEAVGGAKVDKLYTLLDHHELAPRMSYEVCIGDLHAGDACHVPVLVWLPAAAEPASYAEAVRFSLIYEDALKIDTKACDMGAGVARGTVRRPPAAPPPPPPGPSTRDRPRRPRRRRARVRRA